MLVEADKVVIISVGHESSGHSGLTVDQHNE